jgi:hypothetical protein
MKKLWDRATAVAIFDVVDSAITRLMARYGVVILRVALGVVFFWFGALKNEPRLNFDFTARQFQT